MTPRQPILNCRMSRCQFQPWQAPGENEKKRTILTSSLHEKGFFFAPKLTETRQTMEKNQNYMRALKCRECGREYPLSATHVCEFDFGPLEVVYDYDRIKRSLNHSDIQSRPQT